MPVLFAVLFYFGTRYCLRLNKTATSLPIKMKYVYSCVPISMVILMLHALVMGLDELLAHPEKEVKA